MNFVVLKQAQKELLRCPKEFSEDLYSLFSELEQGKKLSMPISRSLSGIAPGLHELRLSGRAGELRVFYYLQVKEAIYIVHASMKKVQKLSKHTIRLLKLRIKAVT